MGTTESEDTAAEMAAEAAARAALAMRVQAVKALSPHERALFVAESGNLIRELVAESEWRQAALLEIYEDMAAAELDDDAMSDEFQLKVHAIYEIWQYLDVFVREGRGMDSSYFTRSTDEFLFDGDAVTEIHRRISTGESNKRNAALVRRVSAAAAVVAEYLENLAHDAEGSRTAASLAR